MRRITEDYPYAGDLTLLGAHSSHSYQTGTNLYFVYDYDIDCEPREEIEKYHKPLNAIIVEEALRVGGSMVHHHGIGKYRTDVDRGGARLGVPHPRGAQAGLRPARHHERRHDLPAAVSDLLVGIDLGSQSAKVVVYDAARHRRRRGTGAARRRPSPPHPASSSTPATTCGRRSASRADGRWTTSARPGLDRRDRALRHPVLPGAAAGRREPGAPVQSWMDERVSRPYEHRRRRRGLGDCLVRLPDPPADRRAARQLRPPTRASGRSTLRAGSGWRTTGCAAFGIRRDQLAELVQPGELLGTVTAAAASATGLPDGVPGVRHRQRQGGRGARLRPARARRRARLAGHLHRGHDRRGRATRAGSSYWTNFSSVPGEYLHESAGIRRGMWTVSWVRDLVGHDRGGAQRRRRAGCRSGRTACSPCSTGWPRPTSRGAAAPSSGSTPGTTPPTCTGRCWKASR